MIESTSPIAFMGLARYLQFVSMKSGSGPRWEQNPSCVKRNHRFGKMKKLILLVGIVVIGCNMHQKTIEINDVQKSELIGVTNERFSFELGYQFTVTVTGWIEGEASLTLLKQGDAFRTKNLLGDVNFTWKENWTNGTAHLQYDPIDVESGSLTLVCEFVKI